MQIAVRPANVRLSRILMTPPLLAIAFFVTAASVSNESFQRAT